MKNSDRKVPRPRAALPNHVFDAHLPRMVASDPSDLNEDILAISEHTRREKRLIDSIAGRTRDALRRALELDLYASRLFYETALAIMRINKEES